MKNFLLDLIFPRFCLGCQKELNLKQASFICETCLNNIVLNSGVQRISRREAFLSGLYAAGKYEDPVLREAIWQFKYQGTESLKKPLSELLIKYLKKENLIEKFTNSILAPIPLTWLRKLSRGFNQSELLAKELSPILNCPAVNLLKRKKFAAPQAKIPDWQKRKENIAGAFCLSKSDFRSPTSRSPEVGLQALKSDFVKIKKVILIDDVATSGATLEEAARVLKEAGIKEVYGLVIATSDYSSLSRNNFFPIRQS